MKTSYKLTVLAVLTAAWTAFIFSNSLQGSDASNGATYSILALIEPLLKLLETLFGEADWFYLLRKAAHMAEFALLGVLATALAQTAATRFARPFTAWAACYGMAVAAFDEFLQGFTGRSSEVTDVLIDWTGLVLGIGLTVAATHLWAYLRKRKKERKIHDGDSNGLQ